MRGQGEEEEGGRMIQQVAGRGSMWGRGGRRVGLGRAQGRTGGRGRGGGYPSALRTQGPERAAIADPGARKPPGAEALGKTISWNRPPREDRAPI